MATSTIPTCKAQLYATLAADTALTSVQVTYGKPYPEPQDEWVWLGEARPVQQHWEVLGNRRRLEEYTLMVRVSVLRYSANQQDATERAFAIVAAIENDLRADPSVGGTVMVAEIASAELAERANDMTREAEVTVGVLCKARI